MTVLAVIGSRTFTNRALLAEHMDEVCAAFDVSVVVSGGAKGADSLAAGYAATRPTGRSLAAAQDLFVIKQL